MPAFQPAPSFIINNFILVKIKNFTRQLILQTGEHAMNAISKKW